MYIITIKRTICMYRIVSNEDDWSEMYSKGVVWLWIKRNGYK